MNKAQNKKNKNWQIIPAKKGGITILENEKPIHSRIDPQTEAFNWVQKQKTGKADIIIVHETGLGYLIQPLLEKIFEINPESPVLLHDFGLKCFIFINEREGLFEIGQKNGIIPDLSQWKIPVLLIEPGSKESIFEFLDDLSLEKSRGHRVLSGTVPGSGKDLLEYTLRAISSKLSDLLTRVEFELVWLRQIIENSRNFSRACPAYFFQNKFQKIPAVIIGAGPTLIEALPFLKKLQDWALIISTDTALKVLMDYGVQPHLVYTLDSQKHSLNHFLHTCGKDTAREISLIADIVAYPRVIDSWPGPVWLSTTARYLEKNGSEYRETTPMADWIESKTGPLGDIQSGGSVATSCFDFARTAGCEPIIFAGQDLAYVGREIHARGTHHNAAWLARINRLSNLDQINQLVINKRNIIHTPTIRSQSLKGFENESVISDYVFDLYRRWFEEAFALAGLEIIFPQGRGAYMKGIKILSWQEIIALMEKNSNARTNPGLKMRSIMDKARHISPDILKPALRQMKNDFLSFIRDIRAENNFQEAESRFGKLMERYPFLFVLNRKKNIILSRWKEEKDEQTKKIILNYLRESFGTLVKSLHKTLSEMK